MANGLPHTRCTTCATECSHTKKAQASQQLDATAEPFSQSHRELTRSSQNEPSSSAACQWNVSTLTKSWEATKLKLVQLYKAAVLSRASSSPDTEWTIDHRAAFLSSLSSSTSRNPFLDLAS